MPQLQPGDEAFLWACDASESLDQLEAAVGVLRNCAGRYVRLADRLDRFAEFFSVRFAEFFSVKLFTQLHRWGQHEENTFNLTSETGNGAFRLEHAERWNDRDRVVLRPDMSKLMRRGNLPGLE